MDDRGRVVILDAADATAFSALMEKMVALQKKEYGIQHMVSCQTFTIVTVAASDIALEEFSI